MGGEGERQRRQAGRQTGIRTKGGEESERKYQLWAEKDKKEKKRSANRRSTHESRNSRGEKLQTRSRILIVFGS